MKRFASIPLSIGLVLALAVPAFAWHVDTQPGQQTADRSDPNVTAKQYGPGGDPFHRVVVKVSPTKVTFGECFGGVYVPNEEWAIGTTLTVKNLNGDDMGVSITKGERARLPEGDYTGHWSNSREVEKFSITCKPAVVPDPAAITIGFTFDGRNGKTTKVVTIPEGCQYRSPWVYMQPSTPFWVQDRTNGERVRTWNSAIGGNYGPLYKGFTKGITCPTP